MIRRLFYRTKKNNRGVAALEFAITLPILVFLVMGILEFGWLFNGWIALRSAAREGARVASAYKELDDPRIAEAVQEHIRNPRSTFKALTPDIENVSAQVTGQRMNHPQGPNTDSVKVTATGEMRPLVGFFVGSDYYQITGEATMRID